MSLTLLALFLPACFALNAAPGPNNLLAFSNASRLGLWPALIGGMGRLPAFAAMITLVAFGLGAILMASEFAFHVVKVFGAVYLVYIGWKMWTADTPKEAATATTQLSELMRRDFLIAIGNPKAIAIFTAFFPQFINFESNVAAQFLFLGGLFLVMELAAVLLYAALGVVLSGVLTSHRLHVLNRGVGGFLIFSGIGLLFKSRTA